MDLNLRFIINSIISDIEPALKKSGMFYRIFSRSKSIESIKKKLELKKDIYNPNGKKMQDIIGIRIVFYFLEDVDIFYSYLKKLHNFIDESNSSKELEEKEIKGLDKLADKVFMPIRLNLIFKMDTQCSKELINILKSIDEINSNLIDTTFEIQLRTVLSEGWHEVEHDLRYKCKNETWWDYCSIESRMLNGIYATLETSERAMENIFSSIALKNYKKKDWTAMLRNHFCIRFIDNTLPDWIINALNEDNTIAKNILKTNRNEILNLLFQFPITYPLKMENIIYLINRVSIKNEIIINHEPNVIKKQLNNVLTTDTTNHNDFVTMMHN